MFLLASSLSMMGNNIGSQYFFFFFFQKIFFFFFSEKEKRLTLKALITTIVLSSALSSAGYFKSRCCKQCGPRSDCSIRSSLIWVHTVCLYAKCKFEKFARRCSRRHKQTTFSVADFLGALRVKYSMQFL